MYIYTYIYMPLTADKDMYTYISRLTRFQVSPGNKKTTKKIKKIFFILFFFQMEFSLPVGSASIALHRPNEREKSNTLTSVYFFSFTKLNDAVKWGLLRLYGAYFVGFFIWETTVTIVRMRIRKERE